MPGASDMPRSAASDDRPEPERPWHFRAHFRRGTPHCSARLSLFWPAAGRTTSAHSSDRALRRPTRWPRWTVLERARKG